MSNELTVEDLALALQVADVWRNIPSGQLASQERLFVRLMDALSARDATIAEQAAEIERSQGQRDAARQTVDKIREEAQKELAARDKRIAELEKENAMMKQLEKDRWDIKMFKRHY